jgi:hypothetical protein
MITRSKARANRQAQNEIESRKTTSTRTTLRRPSSRTDEVIPRAHQPDDILAGNHGQIRDKYAELEAANQMAAEQDPVVLAEATNQRPVNEVVFDEAMLESLATIKARLDLTHTSCKIAWVYFRITTMACQASIEFQQKFASLSSFLPVNQLGCWLGAWPGTVALALLVLLLHLFNVLCLRSQLVDGSAVCCVEKLRKIYEATTVLPIDG